MRRLMVLALGATLALSSCGTSFSNQMRCNANDALSILAAQAVPSATILPCIEAFPAGWTYGGSSVEEGVARFWLESDRAGAHAVQVTLTERCTTAHAVEVSPGLDEAGMRRFEEPISLPPQFSGLRFYTFPGGCITYRFRFARGASSTLVFEVDQALSFQDRRGLVEAQARDGLVLCGAEAQPCAGADRS